MRKYEVKISEEKAHHIDASNFTIEPSGALSFWIVISADKSELVTAFAAGSWQAITLLPSADD